MARTAESRNLAYPEISDGNRDCAYEVLTGERHAQFLDIRCEALKCSVNVWWHIEGVIRGRSKSGYKIMYLPSDAVKLNINTKD